MIFLYTHMQVKPEQERAFLEVSNSILQKVRKEEGNIMCDFLKSTEQEYTYKVVGIWKDAEAYKAHFPREELQEDHDKVLMLLSSPMKAEVFSGDSIELE
ncbi:hypothetical protein GPDM_07255 [Planococcus donghaensis MPA1U2]|uniref:ABM domain-containing protein n=1 Tax=Planococcus donghaensis MPA1U2 TaxID=933115 RepID=E7RG53_9BACL|nr:antibiotic biosynthesis monooxygenase [Planococcus donghaensis]EGA90060.1 hypothetical protein GPDM_07255 [Planococcus donghaensis MPA1U2]